MNAKILLLILAILPAIAAADAPTTMPATAPATMPAMAPTSAPAAPKVVKVTYLGVSVNPVEADLARQLGIIAGAGLKVWSVVPGSPAQLAGLKINDVLVKLDDQLLVNLQQFTVLVRSFAPGSQVALTLYRGKDRLTVNARLAQMDLPAGPGTATTITFPIPAAPTHHDVPNAYTAMMGTDKYRLRYVVEGGAETLSVNDAKTGATVFSGPVSTAQQRATLPPDVPPLLAKFQQDRRLLEKAKAGPTGVFVPTEVTYSDRLYDMTLRPDNGGEFLVVKDKAGATLFTGSVPSQTQRPAARHPDPAQDYGAQPQEPDRGHDSSGEISQ